MTTKTNIRKAPLKQPRKAAGNSVFRHPGFTGKELDPETGFSHFGARYLDHTLLTSWFTVDPMSDKYPSISPYNYCAWNPVKLVDPEGREWDPASKNIIDDFRKTTEQKKEESSSYKTRMKYQQVLDELDELELSSQVYHVENSVGCNGFPMGGTSYDLNNDWVSIKYDGNVANLAHELKHAYQFEKGQISFSSKTGGWADIYCDEENQCINKVLLYDLYDEVEAHQRGELYGAIQKTAGDIVRIYKFEIEGGRYCYPFLDKDEAKYGADNIYIGRDNSLSISSNTNIEILKDNIFRFNGHTYKK